MAVNDGRVVSNFCVAALKGEDIPIYGDGEQTRSFAYVDDTIDGLARLMDAIDFIGPVNLGNPDEFTIRELANLTLELAGSSSRLTFHPAPPDDPSRRRPDIALAHARLGWQPKTALRHGLAMTIEHFRRELGLAARAN
jgi:UDP-glucuronate decarboxylase